MDSRCYNRICYFNTEVIFVLTDNKGRRLGDRWADTQVVCIEDLAKQEDVIDI